MTNGDQETPIPELGPLPDKWSEDPTTAAVRQKLAVAGISNIGEGRRLAAVTEALTLLNDDRAKLTAAVADIAGQLNELRDDFIRYSGPHEVEPGRDSPTGGPVCVCGSSWRYFGCEWLAEKTRTTAQLAQLREVDEVHGAGGVVAGVQEVPTLMVESPHPAGVDLAVSTLTLPFLAQDLDRLLAAARIAGVDAVTFAARAVLGAILEVETGGGL